MNSNGNSTLGAARQRPNATGISPQATVISVQRIDNWMTCSFTPHFRSPWAP